MTKLDPSLLPPIAYAQDPLGAADGEHASGGDRSLPLTFVNPLAGGEDKTASTGSGAANLARALAEQHGSRVLLFDTDRQRSLPRTPYDPVVVDVPAVYDPSLGLSQDEQDALLHQLGSPDTNR